MLPKKNVIALKDVYKRLGSNSVLKGVNLEVPEKSVFAFLGNNGEGKSTTIRILTGLIKADEGEVSVLDLPMPEKSIAIRKQIGCIVDSLALYPQLNAREFLKIGCLLKQLPPTEIDSALEIVDMAKAKTEKIAHYSLGMKQRLALAMALLGKPKLLILDEPTNGLDPHGMQEIRELIKALPARLNCTVFVSSHLLDEVEKMASHVALLSGGVVKSQAELKAITENQSGKLILEVSDEARVQDILSSKGLKSILTADNQISVEIESKARIADINKSLIDKDILLYQSIYKKPSLEEWFLSAARA